MTTLDKHHIVNSHSSVSAIQVTDNNNSIQTTDGKVVVDEEIDSCEGEDYDEKMFQVALVNSVMDTGGNGKGNQAALQQGSGEMSPRSKARYALRKRRRPGDEVSETPPMGLLVSGTLVKNESGADPTVLELPNDPLNELQHVQDGTVTSMSMPSIQLPTPTPIKLKQEPLLQQPLQVSTHNRIVIKQELQQQQNMGATAGGHSHPGIISKPSSSPPALLSSITLQSAPQHASAVPFSVKATGTKKKTSRKRKVKPPKVTEKAKVAETLSISVPNPLLASSSPAQQTLNHSVLRGRQDMTIPSTSSVPCPLPVPSPLDAASSMEVKPSQKVTTSYIPPFDPTKLTKVSEASTIELPLQSRTRVFSVDLDPSTFDFSDLSSIAGGNTENKASADSDLPIFQGRDRAFSFEVFNFAGGDDLLPNPVSSSSMLQAPSLAPVNVEAPTRRPRGDSIIFDPASFQDGGIHEKNALEKARLKDLLPVAQTQQSISHRTNQRRAPNPSGGGITGTYSTSQSSNPMPLLLPPAPSINHTTQLVAGQSRVPHSVHTNTASISGKARQVPTSTTGGSRIASSNRNSLTNPVQIATLPSSLSAGAASNSQSPPTFQMELLNKDGRIGIYLPEARRLRIARFHAKRKMRIWRKRIKYDCRKKLADSRPRIKGRFVKRSDVD